MTEKEKIEFLLKLLREESVLVKGVDQASSLLQSYKWLIDKLNELEEPK